jgi:uncharacterized membrane protein YfcA
MELIFGMLVIIVAYFVKGFSGFGPSLVIVPFITLLYDPPSALVLAAFFDFFAGCILVYSVRKDIRWPFVLSIFIALGAGTVFGTLLLGIIPVSSLKKIIGAVILVFSVLILLQGNGFVAQKKQNIAWLRYPAGFLSGFLGGLVSMSGPPLIIYMKIMYQKAFFRTQLIAIFVLGTAWRSVLFIYHQIPLNIPVIHLIIYFFLMLFGLWLGGRSHLNVKEITFNRMVALILLIPAFSLLIS